MNLKDMIEELISVPSYSVVVDGYSTVDINAYREIFLNSFHNTINKEIDRSLDAKELKDLIDNYSERIDLSLTIALYRRYLWLEPTDTIMYNNFINHIDKTKQGVLRDLVKSKNFDAVLEMVENIFNNLFVSTKLISPVKLRTLADLTWELCQINRGFVDVASMKKTKAYTIRCDYLEELIIQRIIEPKINLFELREFFTFSEISLYILMDCDFGLEVAKRYLNINSTDREFYGHVCNFMDFWNFEDAQRLILQYISVNDFDNALAVINRDYSYYNISSRFASHHTTVV
jgi:hypothetical protein